MYSPRIKPELVRRMYHLRKTARVPMTKLVNVALDLVITDLEGFDPEALRSFVAEQLKDVPTPASAPTPTTTSTPAQVTYANLR